MAEFVSKDLLKISGQVIVENGGDIYLATSRERTIGIYAGASPLSMKLGIGFCRRLSAGGLHVLRNGRALPQFRKRGCGLYPLEIGRPR